jgi:hypothetical protein
MMQFRLLVGQPAALVGALRLSAAQLQSWPGVQAVQFEALLNRKHRPSPDQYAAKALA